MLGDLLFFTGGSKLSDRAIMWRTRGRFVHVEIDLGDGTSIGALTRGVTRHPIPDGALAVTTSAYTNGLLLPRARHYIESMVGKQYSGWDILDFAVSLLFPNGPFLISSTAVDCSQLATNFLIVAGYPVPLNSIMHTELVSPNDIARFLLDKFPFLEGYVQL